MTHLHEDHYPYWLHQQPHRQKMAAILAAFQNTGDELPSPVPVPLLLQAVVVPGDHVPEGQLIEAVALPWFDILVLMQRDPSAMYQLDWRKWEEIIAGAYRQQGFDVVLTPRSNDEGRDVIATHHKLGSIRFYDQVRRYSPDQRVSAEEVRAMLGVLSLHPNVSKSGNHYDVDLRSRSTRRSLDR